MYREKYVRTLLLQALAQLAEEMALKVDVNPETIINEHLLQAALLIEKDGLNETARGFDLYYPKLYDDLIISCNKTNQGEQAA